MPLVALRNVVHDVAFQSKPRGSWARRVAIVLYYYLFYFVERIRGFEQDESRLRSLDRLNNRSELCRTDITIYWPPDQVRLSMDPWAASFLIKEHFEDKTYEQLPGFIPQPGQIVIDVGGHQGLFAVLAAKRIGPSGRLLVIEAFPGNAERLRRNLDLNGVAAQTILVEAAAHDHDGGEIVLHVTNLMSGGHSTVWAARDSRPVPVHTRTLDSLAQEHGLSRVDFIKIDVEGAYLAVLKGATTVLRNRPRIVMEVEGGAADVTEVERLLTPLGYRVILRSNILYAVPENAAR